METVQIEANEQDFSPHATLSDYFVSVLLGKILNCRTIQIRAIEEYFSCGAVYYAVHGWL